MNSDQEKQKPSLLEFPCEFCIKAICKSSESLEKDLLQLIQKNTPDATEKNLSKRSSKKENYTAITITVNAQSQEQLNAIYQDLTDSELVLMAF
jgi:uncharacterized protein